MINTYLLGRMTGELCDRIKILNEYVEYTIYGSGCFEPDFFSVSWLKLVNK